jgi:competence protein ComFC
VPPQSFAAEVFCGQCSAPFGSKHSLDEQGLCRLCRVGATQYDQVWSLAHFDGRIRELIHLYKYEPMRPLGKILGRWLTTALPRDARIDVVTAVPLHWTRLWQRGFNQSWELAKEVSRRTGLPLARPLVRCRSTRTQTGLSPHERRANVKRAFALRDAACVKDKHVLLIDDVLTTGASVNACAAELRRAGARQISILTLARATRLAGHWPVNSVTTSNPAVGETR